MDKYYHFTKYEYLKQISEMGLVPQIGERSNSVDDERKAIFLSKGIMSTILMYFSLGWFYDLSTGENGKAQLSRLADVIKRCDEQLLKRQNKKGFFWEKSIKELESNRSLALQSQKQIENMQTYKSFEEYWGSGVYLSVSDVPDVKWDATDFHNCWVERTIPPEKLTVLLLKNKDTGDVVDEKTTVIHYLMANTDPMSVYVEYTKTLGANDDKYTRNDNIKYFDGYYQKHDEEFKTLKNDYELLEIPLKEYMETYFKDPNKKH